MLKPADATSTPDGWGDAPLPKRRRPPWLSPREPRSEGAARGLVRCADGLLLRCCVTFSPLPRLRN